jgi:hypothetical protein
VSHCTLLKYSIIIFLAPLVIVQQALPWLQQKP